jgi:hypothetical protein
MALGVAGKLAPDPESCTKFLTGIPFVRLLSLLGLIQQVRDSYQQTPNILSHSGAVQIVSAKASYSRSESRHDECREFGSDLAATGNSRPEDKRNNVLGIRQNSICSFTYTQGLWVKV